MLIILKNILFYFGIKWNRSRAEIWITDKILWPIFGSTISPIGLNICVGKLLRRDPKLPDNQHQDHIRIYMDDGKIRFHTYDSTREGIPFPKHYMK